VLWAQGVIISANNTSTVQESAMLEVKSNTKGLLIPRMTMLERANISNPVEGLLVYQTNDVIGFYYYTKGNWTAFVSTSQITDFGSGKVITNNERSLLQTALQTESDPSFKASIASKITNQGSGKVITDAERTKLNADADASVTNEIQTLSVSSNQLSISSGNSITLPDGVPAGTIIAYGGVTVPAGWLLCDGKALNPANYPNLVAAISQNWGNGTNDTDPLTTFNLPDLRGQFLRGVDGTANADPDKASRTALNTGGNTGNAVGSYEPEGLKTHNHTANSASAGDHNHLMVKWVSLPGQGSGSYMTVGGDWGGSSDYKIVLTTSSPDNILTSNAGAHTHAITVGSAGGTETRPKNVYVNYIIKY
jgi:microcystin-dependent protein